MAIQDQINAIKNKYGTMQSNYLNAINSFEERKKKRAEEEYKRWLKKVEKQRKSELEAQKREDKKLSLRQKQLDSMNKFNIAKNIAEEKPQKQISPKSTFYKDLQKQEFKNITGLDYNKKKYLDKTNDYQKLINKKNPLKNEGNLDYLARQIKSIPEQVTTGANILTKNLSEKLISKLPQGIRPGYQTTENISSTIGNIVEGYGSGLSLQEIKNRTAGKTVGEIGSYLSPGTAGSLIFKGGEKIAGKLLAKQSAKIAPKLAKSAISGLIGGVGIKTGQEATGYSLGKKDLTSKNIKESAKNIAKQGAEFAVFNPLLAGGGIIAKKGFSVVKNILRKSGETNIIEPLANELKLNSSPESISKARFNPRSRSALEWHNKSFDNYKKAESDWEEAVYNIQNRFGQKELTKAEEMIAKNEMGYDLNKLADSYDKTYNIYNKAKQGLEKSIQRQSNRQLNPIINTQQEVSPRLPIIRNNTENIAMNKINKGIANKNIQTSTQYMTDVENSRLKDKISGFKNEIKRAVYSSNVDIGKVSKKAEDLMDLQNQSKGTADYILNKSIVDKNGNKISSLSIKDVLSMKNNSMQKQYEDYLFNKHNIDRFNNGKTLLANKDGIEITPEKSMEYIKSYEQAYPEFRNLSEQYNKNWQTFSNEWLSDFLPRETIEYLQQKYPNYVPSYRQLESFGTEIPTNRIVGGVKIKEATGSIKKIIPLNEQISNQVFKIVKANRKNEAYKELLKPVMQDPEKYKNIIEIAKIGSDKANLSEMEVLNRLDGLNAQSEEGINNILDIISNPLTQTQGRDGYLTIFENGVPVTLKIKDQKLFEALNKKTTNNNIDKIINAWTKYILTPFKGAITQYNPFFAARNIARDLPTAYIQGGESNPLKFTGQRIKSVYDIVAKDPLWEQYTALGGRMTTISDNPLVPKIGTGIKQVISKPFKKYSDVLEIAEQFNRFAEFKNVLQKTGDVNQARIAAANVTTNFGKSGYLIKAIDKVIPYSNAAVQSIVRNLQSYKDKPIQTLAKGILSTSIPASVLYYYNNIDKDRKKIYSEIPNDVKNSNYLFVAKNGDVIKLPKTQQTGFFLASLGERMFDYFKNNDKEAFKDSWKGLKQTLMPIDIKSGVIMPATNIMLGGNKDFFGREILPYSMQNLSPEMQRDENTSDVSNWLGDNFGISPKKADYLLDSYAGVIYDIMKKSANKKSDNKIKDVAIKNFTVNTNYNRTTANYYDLINKLRTEKADFNKNISDKKQKVEKQGYSLQSKIGKQLLQNELTKKQQEEDIRLKEATKIINEQSDFLQGIDQEAKVKIIQNYFKKLEEYKR
jgi:hypothetical protein